jgi:hypothetical protein
MKTTTSGTTVQCLRAYSATLPKGTKDALQHRQDLKDFLNMSVATVERIIFEKARLQGLTLVKVQRFLELKGFKVRELEEMPKAIRALGDLLAFGVIRVETLLQDLGYQHSNAVYRLVSGKTDRLSNHKQKVVKKIGDSFVDLLTSERTRWQTIIRPIVESSNGIRPGVQAALVSPTKNQSDDEIIVAGLIKAAEEPLKRLIALAKAPADRKRIREAIGGSTLLSVSTDLNRFCSETAFAQYLRYEAPSPNQH